MTLFLTRAVNGCGEGSCLFVEARMDHWHERNGPDGKREKSRLPGRETFVHSLLVLYLG
jgi:hypothetical protein